MSAIYSCAIATIVCLSGTSADAGLPGISPTPRNPAAVLIAPGLSVIKRPNLKLDKDENEYTYVTRAWTFQEQLLSNRNIIFLGEQVYFQCKKELLSEDKYVHNFIDRTYLPTTLESVRLASEINKKRKRRYSPIEEFRWYEEFLPSYTAKQMGYPNDIVNAFLGVQTQLGKIFGWAFAEGLPLQLFDIAILWTPIESVVRRITEPPHPSWSWSGWIGRVHYKDILANLDWPGGLDFGKIFRKTAALEYDVTFPATLDFEGESVTLGAFIVEPSKQNLLNARARLPVTPHTLLIYDRSGLRCGILHGLQNTEIASTHEGDFQLLRLSEWQTMLQDLGYHGPYISYLLESGYEHREKLFEDVFRNTPWCTLNIVCVQWTGKVWQRVAVGHIHADAWKEAGPAPKKIALN
jgi:hypothetical protein